MHAIGLDRGGCNGTRPMLGCLRRGSTFAARARATHISAHGFNRGRSGDRVIDDAIRSYLHMQSRTLEVPFDTRASAFCETVWGALRRIPYGQTRSYTEIAAAIGA